MAEQIFLAIMGAGLLALALRFLWAEIRNEGTAWDVTYSKFDPPAKAADTTSSKEAS